MQSAIDLRATTDMHLQISSADDVTRLLAEPVALLYKHSNTCWISEMAEKVVTDFERQKPDIPVYTIDVRFERGLSLALAEKLGVPHESPQVILLRGGEPVWDASHLQITRELLGQTAA